MFIYLFKSSNTYKQLLVSSEEELDFDQLVEDFYENTEPAYKDSYRISDFFKYLKTDAEGIQSLEYVKVKLRNTALVPEGSNFIDSIISYKEDGTDERVS